jgi:hypothetical protein
MRKLIKDSEDNVFEMDSLNGLIPDGYTEVPAEEIEAKELALAKRNKMSEIRAKRDSWLLANDKKWLIASKKAEPTNLLEQDAAVLRNLPESAEAALAFISTVENVKSYDAFSGLVLSQSYE